MHRAHLSSRRHRPQPLATAIITASARKARPSRLSWALAAALLAALPGGNSAHAASGVWNNNANTVWSTPGNWLGTIIADGAGSTADFSQLNLTAGTRTITIDGAVASRTIGTFLIGDSDAADNRPYIIAASGGGTLTFDNSGQGAALTQISTSRGDTFSVPIILNDSLLVTNNSANLLTFSGGFTSTGNRNLTLSTASTGGITISTGSINHTGTLTNAGSGGGATTINSVIDTNVTAVVQNSATSQLTLSGTNTFAGGVTVKKGTLVVNNNAALGTGTLLLGDSTGTANAALVIGSFTVANPIIVQAGTSGNTLTIASSGTAAARITNNITLNKDVTLSVTGAGGGRNTGALLNTATTTTISGTGNLNLNVSGGVSTSNNTGQPQIDSLSVSGPVTTSGSINNVGTGAGRALISGVIDNASSINQSSETSMLTLSGANTYAGPTNVNAGILRIGSLTGLSINSAVTVAPGATLQLGTNNNTAFNIGQTLTISGQGASYAHGALESTNNTNYGGNVVLQTDATVASGLANSTLALSGTITGAGRTLTIAGVGSTNISAAIETGTGGLVKTGIGTATLSGTNGFTGVTRLLGGALVPANAGALGGEGLITFGGGSLRHSATNTLDYASRIANSAGAIAIDTGGQNVTYFGDFGASNIGGLTKIGTGRLTLSGNNSYKGLTAVSTGVLSISAPSSLPGSVFIDTTGALNSGGAFNEVQAWLASGKIAPNSTGAIALTANNFEMLDFAGYGTLSLGASSNASFSGTITPAGSTYRLGGGGATLTVPIANTLTGSNGLITNGAVTITGFNDITGATTIAANTLTLSGGSGSLSGSAITAEPGSTLAIIASTSATIVTRASAVTLNRATLTVTGNSSDNSIDEITGALTIGSSGNSTVTLSGPKNALLTASSVVRQAGGTALLRGTGLGVNSIDSKTASSTNLQVTTATLVGGTGSGGTDGGILVGVVGDTASNGTGFGATGGLLTRDDTNGVRLVSGYKTSLTDGQTQIDNVQLSSASGTVTTPLTLDTMINSLSLRTSGAANAAVQINGAGKLTISSGVLYSGSVTSTTANSISNAIDFNGREAVLLVGGTSDLTLSGVLGNTGGNGLTLYGNQEVIFSGTAANTYTGTTTVNGGTLNLSKTAGINAIPGNLVLNAGTVIWSASNQIADSANITASGGTINIASDTLHDLTLSGGAVLNGNVAGALVVSGTTNLSAGGVINLARSQNITGAYDSVTTLGPVNITHLTTGTYTPIVIGHGNGLGQAGAKLVLTGDVTFIGNATNTSTATIDALKGTGRQGILALAANTPGNRTFNIGDGAAMVDFAITAPMTDGTGGASDLTKGGLGTLAISGTSIYTGATTVNAGTLLVNGSISGSAAIVNTGGTLGGTGLISSAVSVASGGTLLGGDGWTLGEDLTLGGNLTLADASRIQLTLGPSGTHSTLSRTGGIWSFDFDQAFSFINAGATETTYADIITGLAANPGTASWTIVTPGFAGSFSYDNGTVDLTLTAVPEPSAVLSLIGGASLLLGVRRRRSAGPNLF